MQNETTGCFACSFGIYCKLFADDTGDIEQGQGFISLDILLYSFIVKSVTYAEVLYNT